MDTTSIVETLREGVLVVIWVAGPMLLLSMAVGVLVAIFQAVTQIHEQTLGFILKLLVIILFFMIAGGWMLEHLLDYSRQIFMLIGEV